MLFWLNERVNPSDALHLANGPPADATTVGVKWVSALGKTDTWSDGPGQL